MLHRKTTELCQGPNFAVFTTLFASGQPQSGVMWVHSDADHVLINTEVHRAKFKNVEADPRVTVTIIDATSPYSYVEVRGKVVETIVGDDARASIDEMSQKYMGKDYANPIQSERVILRILPDREVLH